MKRLLLCFVLALSALCARGDDTAVYGVGGALQPMREHPSVVMDEMLVDARVTPETSTVDCRFVFRNTGPAVTVKMGFPESGNANAGTGAGFTSFNTWVDGVRVRATVEGYTEERRAGTWHRWRVKTVRFAAGQTRRVRVRYSARTTEDSTGGRRFEYAVGTGGSWKGPIGRGVVRVRVDCDPAQYIVEPSGHLVAAGEHEFAWRKERFEPSPGQSVGLRLEPSYCLVDIGRPAVERLDGDLQRYRSGSLWAPVRMLGYWLSAEVDVAYPTVIITSGRRSLALRQGGALADSSQGTVRLPGAPFAEQGELYVPLRAVAVALGCEVGYTAGRPAVVHLRRPGRGEVEAALGQQALVALDSLSAGEPGWALPETAEFSEEARQAARRDGRRPPWLTMGDFNGDGSEDAALMLWKDDSGALLVLHRGEGDVFEPVWLVPPHEPEPGSFPPRREAVEQVLRTVSPGVIAYWQENETAPKSGRLDLRHDGVEGVYLGKGAVLFYWDGEAKAYRSVVSAD
jgi:hypothetical protein